MSPQQAPASHVPSKFCPSSLGLGAGLPYGQFMMVLGEAAVDHFSW